jgi:hypothetical protein
MSSLAAALAIVLAAAPAADPQRTDNPHFEPARAAFEAEDWDTAAREFEAAYAFDGRLEYLYAQAQAERLGGHCEQATATYERFIAEGPPPAAVAEAEENLAKCEPAPPPPRPEPRTVQAPAPQPRPKRWYRDPWGHVAVIGGVAIAATGAGFLGAAHARERDAAGAEDEQLYRDAIAGAPTMSRVGIGLLSAGAALIVVGIVRWSVLAAAERRRAR